MAPTSVAPTCGTPTSVAPTCGTPEDGARPAGEGALRALGTATARHRVRHTSARLRRATLMAVGRLSGVNPGPAPVRG
ncbi:hypothetical protein [Kitasatospora sp. NBC_00315]|uniref:hypothetical protein n=1 Tax=Kitasatospora sp. NBC_00315 TaxID=2975963 RepID=UPI003250F36F